MCIDNSGEQIDCLRIREHDPLHVHFSSLGTLPDITYVFRILAGCSPYSTSHLTI